MMIILCFWLHLLLGYDLYNLSCNFRQFFLYLLSGKFCTVLIVSSVYNSDFSMNSQLRNFMSSTLETFVKYCKLFMLVLLFSL